MRACAIVVGSARSTAVSVSFLVRRSPSFRVILSALHSLTRIMGGGASHLRAFVKVKFPKRRISCAGWMRICACAGMRVADAQPPQSRARPPGGRDSSLRSFEGSGKDSRMCAAPQIWGVTGRRLLRMTPEKSGMNRTAIVRAMCVPTP